MIIVIMTSQSHTTVVVKEDEANVINSLSKFIEECAEKAVKDHGKFYLGVSGKACLEFWSMLFIVNNEQSSSMFTSGNRHRI